MITEERYHFCNYIFWHLTDVSETVWAYFDDLFLLRYVLYSVYLRRQTFFVQASLKPLSQLRLVQCLRMCFDLYTLVVYQISTRYTQSHFARVLNKTKKNMAAYSNIFSYKKRLLSSAFCNAATVFPVRLILYSTSWMIIPTLIVMVWWPVFISRGYVSYLRAVELFYGIDFLSSKDRVLTHSIRPGVQVCICLVPAIIVHNQYDFQHSLRVNIHRSRLEDRKKRILDTGISGKADQFEKFHQRFFDSK